jgi:hypothetical protein
MHKPTAWLGTLVASVALPAAAQDQRPGGGAASA